jgi:hypothetical protein
MSYLRILGTTLVLAGSAQLTTPAHAAPQPVVVPIMQKDLADTPRKEMLMITVEYPAGLCVAGRERQISTHSGRCIS